MAHRGNRVIDTDTLRISPLVQVSSDGQEREQDSEDNPNIDVAHQNNPLACTGPSRGTHCRHITLGRKVPMVRRLRPLARVEQVASMGQVTELTLTGRSWTEGSMYGGSIGAPGAQPSGNHRTRVA